MAFQKAGQPWLYDNTTGDIVGIKDPDGSETYFAAVLNGQVIDPVTKAVLGSGGVTATLPVDTLFAQIGHSFIAFGESNSGNSQVIVNNKSFWNLWGNGLSKGKLRDTVPSMFGIAGENSTQILARFDANVPATNAKIVLVSMVENDVLQSVATDVTIKNMSIMMSKIRLMGAKGIFQPCVPLGGLTAPMETLRVNANAWLQQQVAPDLRVLDISAWNMATMSDDATPLHPNIRGSMTVLGPAVAKCINELVVDGSPLFTSNDNTYNLITNGFLPGAGGSLSARNTGQVATGFAVSNDATGMNTVWSKIARALGLGDWQQQVISGTVDANGRYSRFLANNIAFGSSLASGTKVEGFCEIEWDAGLTNIHSVNIDFYTATGFTRGGQASPSGTPTPLPNDKSFSGVIRTPVVTLTGIATQYILTFNVEALAAGLIAGTIRIGRIGYRVVA